VNAAKDSTELVAKLRSYHNSAQNAPTGDPKKALLHYGLDLLNGEVRDNVKAGVLEPTVSKVRSLKSAFEAAVSLLRIDDAIHCVPGEFGVYHPSSLLINIQSQNLIGTHMATSGDSLVSDAILRLIKNVEEKDAPSN
jgi:TCP-1/cpn60 chaperonin family